VMPYSTRARPGALVSTPLDWTELDGPQPKFHLLQVLERLQDRDDPWGSIFDVHQAISSEAVSWLRGGA
jgi:bifunctional non-homologous end joining protein LigD